MADDLFYIMLDLIRDIDEKLGKLLEFYQAVNRIRESNGINPDPMEQDFFREKNDHPTSNEPY